MENEKEFNEIGADDKMAEPSFETLMEDPGTMQENQSEQNEDWKRVYEGWDDLDLQLEEDGRRVYKIIEEIEISQSEKGRRSAGMKIYRVGLGIEPDAVAQAERMLDGEGRLLIPPYCHKVKLSDGGEKFEIENCPSLDRLRTEKKMYGGKIEQKILEQQIEKPADQLEEHNASYGQKIVGEVAAIFDKVIPPEASNSVLPAAMALIFVSQAINNSGMDRLSSGVLAVLAGSLAAVSYIIEAGKKRDSKNNIYGQSKKREN